jgi:hypothetical protein
MKMKWKKEYWYIVAIVAAIAIYYFWKKNQLSAPAPPLSQRPTATLAGYQAYAQSVGEAVTAQGFENYKAGIAAGSAAFLGGGR